MLKIDKNNRLSENEYSYMLQDVAEPELFRTFYEYTSIPKVGFNERHVPMVTPEELWITDTTFSPPHPSPLSR